MNKFSRVIHGVLLTGLLAACSSLSSTDFSTVSHQSIAVKANNIKSSPFAAQFEHQLKALHANVIDTDTKKAAMQLDVGLSKPKTKAIVSDATTVQMRVYEVSLDANVTIHQKGKKKPLKWTLNRTEYMTIGSNDTILHSPQVETLTREMTETLANDLVDQLYYYLRSEHKAKLSKAAAVKKPKIDKPVS